MNLASTYRESRRERETKPSFYFFPDKNIQVLNQINIYWRLKL